MGQLGQCSICQEQFESISSVSVLLCGHTFHHHCVLQWLERSKTCPSCRKRTDEKQVVPQLFFDFTDSILVPPPSNSTNPLETAVLEEQLSKLHGELSTKKRECDEKDAELTKIRRTVTTLTAEKGIYQKKQIVIETMVSNLKKEVKGLQGEYTARRKLEDQMKVYKGRLHLYSAVQKTLEKEGVEDAQQALELCDEEDVSKCFRVLKRQYDAVRKEKEERYRQWMKSVDSIKRMEEDQKKQATIIRKLKTEVKMLSDYKSGNPLSPYDPSLKSMLNKDTPGSVTCVSKKEKENGPIPYTEDSTDVWSTTVVAGSNGKLVEGGNQEEDVGDEELGRSLNVMLPGRASTANPSGYRAARQRAVKRELPSDGYGGRVDLLDVKKKAPEKKTKVKGPPKRAPLAPKKWTGVRRSEVQRMSKGGLSAGKDDEDTNDSVILLD